jgi:hypothetical protein
MAAEAQGFAVASMKTPNEFWLNLHRLAEAYDSEGLTPDERAESILNQFRAMPPIAQRQVLSDMVRLVANLPDLYPLVVLAGNEKQQQPVAAKGHVA